MPWTTYSGDEIEAVVAICLCIDNPTATRIKPSRGDKGIDVLVPQPDGWVVYQVKSFIGRLTSSQKNQIKKSWQTLAGYMAQRGGTLKEWYLVTPEDPTTEKIEWLAREVTTGFAGPAVWRGGGFVDSLAARHPEVIDYYLRDGKDRLEDKLKSFLAIVHNQTPDGIAIDAAAGIDKLISLHQALNATDPHYHYDFSVDTLPADGADPPPIPPIPRLAVVGRHFVGRTCVTVKVIGRYVGAAEDRPISWKLSLTNPSAEVVAAWHDLLDFGVPFESTTDSFVVDLRDTPGGLGHSGDGDRVRVGWHQRSHDDFQLSAEILDSGGEVRSRALIDIESSTEGVYGDGVRGVGREVGGVFDFEIRLKADKASITFSPKDMAGADPATILAGLGFLRDLRPPNTLRVSYRDGHPLADGVPIPAAVVDEQDGLLAFGIADALVEIQRHCDKEIRFPGFAEIEMSELEGLATVARLLRGETMPVDVEELQVCLTVDQIADGISARLPFVVTVGSAEIPFGWLKLSVSAAQLAPGESRVPHEDHVDLRVVPADGAECVLTWLGSDEAADGN